MERTLKIIRGKNTVEIVDGINTSVVTLRLKKSEAFDRSQVRKVIQKYDSYCAVSSVTGPYKGTVNKESMYLVKVW